MLILLPALFFAPVSALESRDTPTHKWFCTASGLDSQQRARSVSGPFKPIRREAETAAVQQCLIEGLMACRVQTCIDESIPLAE